MTYLHVPLPGGGLQKTTMGESETSEQHYKQGHAPKRKDRPAYHNTSHPVVRHHLRSYRSERGEGLYAFAHLGAQSTERHPEYVGPMGGTSQINVR
eukprot:6197249-Prorocentrum_lima.AAC.1